MGTWLKSTLTLLIAIAVGLAARTTLGADQTTPNVPATPNVPETIAPLQVGLQGMTGDELFAKLLEHNRIRDERLREYTTVRTYEVTNDRGKSYAREVVRVAYQAPDHKSFQTESEEGSAMVRKMVLNRLIESESETSSGRAHHDSAIKPANYEFNLLGEQDVGSYHCLLVEATPKRKDKYLFEGKIWIDAQDYAIVRIAGQPAKSPSFWITRADFVRQYQKIGEFWVPAQDETFVRMRMAGKKILTIQHRDYAVNQDASEGGHDVAAENLAKETR
jgi:hypothetical protein